MPLGFLRALELRDDNVLSQKGLDDVWQLSDAQVFDVFDAQGRLVIPTMDPGIFPRCAREIRLESMSMELSVELLARWAGVPASQFASCETAVALVREITGQLSQPDTSQNSYVSVADMFQSVTNGCRRTGVEQTTSNTVRVVNRRTAIESSLLDRELRYVSVTSYIVRCVETAPA